MARTRRSLAPGPPSPAIWVSSEHLVCFDLVRAAPAWAALFSWLLGSEEPTVSSFFYNPRPPACLPQLPLGALSPRFPSVFCLSVHLRYLIHDSCLGVSLGGARGRVWE